MYRFMTLEFISRLLNDVNTTAYKVIDCHLNLLSNVITPGILNHFTLSPPPLLSVLFTKAQNNYNYVFIAVKRITILVKMAHKT